MTPPNSTAPQHGAQGWFAPGPFVLRLTLVALVAVALSSAVAVWLVTHAAGQEAIERVVSQQTDEVEVVARLLASKIEQSQKVLRTVASGVTPGMLESPSALEWLLQQGLPAVQFFDTILVARADGELRLNLRAGQLQQAADLDPAERDALRRTLIDGKPLVSELIAGPTSDARVLFTMPLHREDGSVLGVVAGALRLQSQSLLPPSLTLPARDDSKLVVFTRDGVILSHTEPARIMGRVHDEPGLAPVYARWLDQVQPVEPRGVTDMQPQHIVSMAGMPLPQWIVARVSPSQAMLASLQGTQRKAWWLAGASVALCMLLLAISMWWMAQPLARVSYRARLLLKGVVAEEADDHGPAPALMDWPSAGGEIGSLVRTFQGLGEQRRQLATDKTTLDGQFQAILDNASVGIVISRDGMLEVVGRQAGVMLGYRTAELQGSPARVLYASDQAYAQMGERVRSDFATHGMFDGDVCFMRKDRTPIWARVQGRGVNPGPVGGATVWILEDITADRQAQAQAQHAWELTHDTLTQLYNRVAFDDRLGLLLAERAARSHSRPAPDVASKEDGVVLFLDLDHFTVVNDVAGHDAGDNVLRHVARLLESHVRQIGWAARVGGDEFAVVLPGCALARGQAVAEQLRAAVQAWEPAFQGRSFTLGASIGLVELDASLHDAAAVLYAADMACYDAKRGGRNRVETRHAGQVQVSGRMALGSL